MMNDYDLIVIGGGSAGIAACVSAKENGIDSILLIEREHYLGGILLQCIHNGFGLQTYNEELTGPEYAHRVSSELFNKNIEYKVDTTVVEITKDLRVTYVNAQEGYQTIQGKAIVCATGCSERTRGAIATPGDRPQGVMSAGQAQKYLNIHGYMVGKKVFILGSGDIGLIMARRMVLEGATVLGVAEIMPYSNGLNRNIVQCLEDYNIPLYLSHTVKKIIGNEKLEKIILSKVDEKFNYIDGTEKEFDVDTLLLSVGLVPSNPLLEAIGVKVHPKTKGPIVNECLMTSVPGIFSCGNSLHVHDLVDFVTIEGKKAGLYAAKYIKNELLEDVYIEVKPGEGINYILPSNINLSNVDKISLNLRVSKPHQNCELIVKSGGVTIKKIRKIYLIPSEMEKIEFAKELITSQDLLIEVKDA